MDLRSAIETIETISAADDPRLDGWYHTIDLGGGLVTRGIFDLRPHVERYGFPRSLAGKSVLDVGTGDGFFAFEFERREAARVLAVDVPTFGDLDMVPRIRAKFGEVASREQPWAERFRIAQATLDSAVEYRPLSVYELGPDTVGTFDVVFCGSLLLHLHNPFEALMRIRSVTRELAIIETAIQPQLEEEHPGEPILAFGAHQEDELGVENTYWLLTTRTLERMLEYAGFARTERRGVFDFTPTGPRVTVVGAYAT